MTKLVIVVRYDLDETEAQAQAIGDRVEALRERLAGLPVGVGWVAIGEPCERVIAAMDAEADR